MNILFVCTMNIQRSKTAERIFKELCQGKADINISSAGIRALTSQGGVQITKEMIDSADKIYVMEYDHQHFIENLVPQSRNKIMNLNVDDVFYRDDPELVEILTRKLKDELKILRK